MCRKRYKFLISTSVSYKVDPLLRQPDIQKLRIDQSAVRRALTLRRVGVDPVDELLHRVVAELAHDLPLVRDVRVALDAHQSKHHEHGAVVPRARTQPAEKLEPK